MSDELCDNKTSRRAFLRTLARAAAAAFVSGAGIYLVVKKRIAYRDEQACDTRVLCEGCARLEGCVLPRALYSRLAPGRFSSARPSRDASRFVDVPSAPADPVKNEA